MHPAVVLLVVVSFVCWVLFKARRSAAADAAAAREALSRAEVEREQLRGELAIANERLHDAASAESALARHRAERDEALAQLEQLRGQFVSVANRAGQPSREEVAALSVELLAKRDSLVQLQREIGALEAHAELQSFGLYRPHYSFDMSDSYKAKLEEVRDRQAGMLKDKTAALFSREWTVDGSVVKGQQMIGRQVKLMLRAFNGESDAAVAKVRFNNVVALDERIRSAFLAVNKLGETHQCAITEAYLELKLAELRLAYEYALKLYEEREEQRRIREQMREEEIVRREMEEQQRTAEREEERASRALEQARSELSYASIVEKSLLAAQIAALEAQLAEAHAKTLRAVSMAQLTRAGHVYVISNEGSFGPDVYKIGMTRRKDPEDRVIELGDASVPFGFDIHAMIYSDDAPELERTLHRTLSAARINLANERKEFFAVNLSAVEAAVRTCHAGRIEFTRLAIAEEWRRTRVMRENAAANNNAHRGPVVTRALAG